VRATPKLFTIGASAPFATILARGLIARLGNDPLALAGVTIYLPTRRAARGFGDAFAKELGGAALLPQFRALGDVDEDDLLYDSGSDVELTPAIAPLRRQVLLAQLVQRWHVQTRGAIGFAQASALARALMQLMDEMEDQGADPSAIADLAPLPLAEHWQEVGGFLAWLYQQWLGLLQAEGRIEMVAHRNMALRALAARLASSPPDGMVIAAGSTGSIPATAELLGAIARLPGGAVVLPGLDRELDDESWNDLDPGHPQYGLKQLLARIGVARDMVGDWHGTAPNVARETLLRETLRPAPTTDAWRALIQSGGGDLRAGTSGLAMLSASDPAHEALTIALTLREALETPGRTAALVTTDRKLARRVAGELRRWDITIDDSAGRPLAHTSAGAFLCLIADAAASRFAPVPLLALLKHPFARRGDEAATFRAQARALDLALRGPRPDPGLDGVTRSLGRAGTDLQKWWLEIAAILAPLETLFVAQDATLSSLVAAHVAAAQILACDDKKDCLLWSKTDGEVARLFVEKLRSAAAPSPSGEELPPLAPTSYAPLFRQMALEPMVRENFGQHPRLAILGAGEARLQSFDLTVLGGLNENAWPAAAAADPWFSRPMRDALGLEQPERNMGKAAHDFAMLAAGPQVLLTRALKADGAPTVPSRWLQRLEQLLLGLHPGLPKEERRLEYLLPPQTPFAALAAQMQAAPPLVRLPRPRPTPPVALRPRRLSVTEIETWLRDPYAIYARHVLKLKPLDLLDEDVGPLERGTILHGAVEEFVRRYPKALPDDAEAILTTMAAALFVQAGIPKAAQAVWLPRFADAARGFLVVERQRRADIATPHVELKGSLSFRSTGGEFTLTGRADRIDVMQDGTAQIVDYKSGAVPSIRQVEQMISPQLSLEAAMLAQNGFGIGAHETSALIYLSLADGRKASDPTVIDGGAALGAEALARLQQRVARYDEADMPYHPRVMPLRVDSEGDYDHLARVREWSASGEDA
jgi:ATP-dependent helicase/nuclease subunit B